MKNKTPDHHPDPSLRTGRAKCAAGNIFQYNQRVLACLNIELRECRQDIQRTNNKPCSHDRFFSHPGGKGIVFDI